MPDSQTIYLDFPRSDGTPNKWPVDLDSSPVQDEVNFMRPIAHDEPLAIKWKTQIGREVAKLLGINEYNNYALKDFPEGYKFYQKRRGPAKDPRTDPYLCGSPSGRYRSPPEFIRHAYWLMTDDTLDRKNCKCKYCGSSKQRQSEISHDLGLKPGPSTSTNTSASTSASTSAPSTKPVVRPVARPRKRPTLSGNPVNRERIADLRTSRRFRPGELVWCALSPAIQGEHEHERIEFWPGLVNEARLKSDVLPHAPGVPWRVIQSTVFKIKLLGIMHSCVLSESAILPYQAYGPSMELIEHLRLVGSPTLLHDRQRLSEFHPIPPDEGPRDNPQSRFVEASTPFALAIQIAAHLVRMWTPTEEWKFHGEVYPPGTTDLAGNGALCIEINETRHQGLWWGAERIWTDELVRLQPSRAQVVPQGSSTIHRASLQATGRGVLMRINSIIAALGGSGRDSQRSCKVAGVLYELVDETYEEEPDTETVPMDTSLPGAARPLTPPAKAFPGGSILPDSPGSGYSPAPDTFPFQNNFSPSTIPTDPLNPALFPLPKPPSGFKFRPIMKAGYEIVLDVSLVSGRYYPDLLKHPLLQDAIADLNPKNARVSQLTALCGLVAGAVNSMECVDWAATRLGMVKQSDLTAQQDLFQYWHPGDVEMEEALNVDVVKTEDVAELLVATQDTDGIREPEKLA